jgi:hypothetical protein
MLRSKLVIATFQSQWKTASDCARSSIAMRLRVVWHPHSLSLRMLCDQHRNHVHSSLRE